MPVSLPSSMMGRDRGGKISLPSPTGPTDQQPEPQRRELDMADTTEPWTCFRGACEKSSRDRYFYWALQAYSLAFYLYPPTTSPALPPLPGDGRFHLDVTKGVSCLWGLCALLQPLIFPIQHRLLSLSRRLSERWDRAPGPVGRLSQSRPLAAHRFAAA